MGEQWKKFASKQPKSVGLYIYSVTEKIISLDWEGLDIKPMQGKQNQYRCRVGKQRIVFTKKENRVQIKKIGNRGDVY